jgi:hypothetical protein
MLVDLVRRVEGNLKAPQEPSGSSKLKRELKCDE